MRKSPTFRRPANVRKVVRDLGLRDPTMRVLAPEFLDPRVATASSCGIADEQRQLLPALAACHDAAAAVRLRNHHGPRPCLADE